MNFWPSFWGTAVGVVAGTLVTLATTQSVDWWRRRQELKNLRFELRMAQRRLQEWLQEATRWRDAIVAEGVSEYFGYFKVSLFPMPTLLQMFREGRLYKHFSDTQLIALLEAAEFFTPAGEGMINRGVAESKQLAARSAPKPDVVKVAAFWTDKLGDFKRTVDSLAETLGQR